MTPEPRPAVVLTCTTLGPSALATAVTGSSSLEGTSGVDADGELATVVLDETAATGLTPLLSMSPRVTKPAASSAMIASTAMSTRATRTPPPRVGGGEE